MDNVLRYLMDLDKYKETPFTMDADRLNFLMNESPVEVEDGVEVRNNSLHIEPITTPEVGELYYEVLLNDELIAVIDENTLETLLTDLGFIGGETDEEEL